MKIGVFGDSYADKTQDELLIWWGILKQTTGHDVECFGESASSIMFSAKKMNPIDIAKLIEFIISMKDSVAVQDILVEVPDLDWNDINLE